jgi:hypothetical protein
VLTKRQANSRGINPLHIAHIESERPSMISSRSLGRMMGFVSKELKPPYSFCLPPSVSNPFKATKEKMQAFELSRIC